MITHHSSHILPPGHSELEILSSSKDDVYLYSIQLNTDKGPPFRPDSFKSMYRFMKNQYVFNISNMIEICDFTIMGNPIFVNFEGTKVNLNRTSISMFSEPVIISNTFTPILNKKGGGLKIKLFNPTSNIVKLYIKALLKTKNELFTNNKWYIFNTSCFKEEESILISAARSGYFNANTLKIIAHDKNGFDVSDDVEIIDICVKNNSLLNETSNDKSIPVSLYKNDSFVDFNFGNRDEELLIKLRSKIPQEVVIRTNITGTPISKI